MNDYSTSLPVRFWRIFRVLLWFFAASLRLFFLPADYSEKSRAILQHTARRLLAILHIEVDGPSQLSLPPVFLGVANHVSWLDVFAMMALYPTVFIGKRQIRSWPLIGSVAARAGTVFINRDSRNDVRPINEAIRRALAEGRTVSFFPEAKTSHGLSTLPFKAALFQPAVDSGTPVMALSLRYYDQLGNRSTKPAYVGDMNLLVSLWRIVSVPAITVRADFSEPLLLDDEDRMAENGRFLLKDRAESFIRDTVAQH